MVYRGRLNNLIFEFSIAEKPFCNIILCEGLPSVPKQKELMTHLSNNGCNVFFPRYSGTWESEGEFLIISPTEDIYNLVRHLKNGSATELYGGKTFNTNYPTHLVGSSFGGTVALSLIPRDSISKIVALSPIIDFKTHNNDNTEQDLNWLKSFIQKAFGSAYRFSDQNWDLMINGELFNPPQEVPESKAGNVLIVYDTTDKEINPGKIAQYVSKNKISTIVTDTAGHLSLSKIPHYVWERIIGFFKFKN